MSDAGARTAGFVLVAIPARPVGRALSARWHPTAESIPAVAVVTAR